MIDTEANVPLAEKLAVLLSNIRVFVALTQGYHWNVKGADFKELHAFFSDIYDDVDDSIDPLAENILKLGYDAPYLLEDFIDMSVIGNVQRITNGDGMAMVQSLYESNKIVIGLITVAFDEASSATTSQSIANFLADRLDMHQKWNWQLAATLGMRN